MGKGFLKFKHKLRIGALLRSMVMGGSLGITAVACRWLVAKLTAQEVNMVLYVAESGIFAVLVSVLVLAFLFPTERRIAKKLDANLSLGEKVQTMLAFRNDSGDMAALQREDTDRILLETPKRKVKGACTWLFILLPVIACLGMIGTILVPAKEPPTPPVIDHAYSMTPWQEQALKDLIEEVKTSELEESPKESVVKQLDSLLIKLKSVRKESVMKETVISTIKAIHAAVSEHNTYDLVAEALQNSTTASVRELGVSINAMEALVIGDWMNNTEETILIDQSVAASLSIGINQALMASGVNQTDSIRQALQQLSDDLGTVSEETSNEAILSILDCGELLLNSVLHVQAVNEDVEEDTIYTLLSIFGIKASEVPEYVFNNPDDPRGEGDYDPEDDMDKIHAGGIGTGEMIFGSNDTVFDPETGTFVPYGSIIDRYYARISEILVDGRLTPEMEKAISDYFAILFDGSEQKESSGLN